MRVLTKIGGVTENSAEAGVTRHITVMGLDEASRYLAYISIISGGEVSRSHEIIGNISLGSVCFTIKERRNRWDHSALLSWLFTTD